MKLCSEKWAVTTDVFLLAILWLFEAFFQTMCCCFIVQLLLLHIEHIELLCKREIFFFFRFFFWHFQPLGQMLCHTSKGFGIFLLISFQWFLFSSGWCGRKVGTGSQESHWEAVALSGTEWPLFPLVFILLAACVERGKRIKMSFVDI